MYASYPCKFTRDDNTTYMVTFPDVPEAVTDVVDKETFNARAAEALAAAFSFYVESGKALPRPSAPKRGQGLVYLSAATVAKLALYDAMRQQGVTQSELARRLGCHRQHAARIVDPAHNTRFEVLEAALAAVGKRAALHIQDAA
jgi:antitoxin HicB